jgi:transcription factor Ssl1
VLLLLSSLTSCDPGSISDTLEALVTSKVRVSVVCLAAETKLARDLTIKTGGTFGVALNEGHLRDLMWESIPPPALTGTQANKQPAPGGARSSQPASDLMMMGFPTRLPDSGFATLCACHANLKPEGFLCPRCGAKLCDVPTDCDVCGLLVVSSPHLARSYHHLFPVAAWAIVCVSLATIRDFHVFADQRSGLPIPGPFRSTHRRSHLPARAARRRSRPSRLPPRFGGRFRRQRTSASARPAGTVAQSATPTFVQTATRCTYPLKEGLLRSIAD